MREQNKEGYHDPTAERAIKRAVRHKYKRKQTKHTARTLYYTLGELACFQQILTTLGVK